MSVINISPESFFAGSYITDEQIRETVEEMRAQGAQLIDIGARSTAPGSIPISVQDEKDRIISALKSLEGTDCTISIDTMHPDVLLAALKFDIHAANDISGLVNPDMADVIADCGLPAVLMATNKIPGDCLTFSDTTKALMTVKERAENAGIEQYILDPAIGRWIPERAPSADFELCKRFNELLSYERPLLAAISRKSFIGSAIGKEPDERLAGTLGVTAHLILAGASMIRCHDVAETSDVIRVMTSIMEA
jgi:dihydropteroate synthase